MMTYILVYVVGVFFSAIIFLFLARNSMKNTILDQEWGMYIICITYASILWPLVLPFIMLMSFVTVLARKFA